jgi:hypothetical protein
VESILFFLKKTAPGRPPRPAPICGLGLVVVVGRPGARLATA